MVHFGTPNKKASRNNRPTPAAAASKQEAEGRKERKSAKRLLPDRMNPHTQKRYRKAGSSQLRVIGRKKREA